MVNYNDHRIGVETEQQTNNLWGTYGTRIHWNTLGLTKNRYFLNLSLLNIENKYAGYNS